MEQTLSTLKEGQRAKITALPEEEPLHRRLQDFGLIEGTEITCLRKSPSGSPVLYRVRGTMLALRTADGNRIFVKRCR